MVASFVAGLLCTAAVHGPTLLDPVPEPYFGLDVAGTAPAFASPILSSPAEPRPPRPPQRLALGPAAAPIAAGIEAQALPTSGEGQAGRVERAAPTGVADAGEFIPPSATPSSEAPPVPAPPRAAGMVPTESLRALVERMRQARAAAVPPPQTAVDAVPAPTAKPPPEPEPDTVPADAASDVPPQAAADDVGGGESPAPRPAGRLFGLLAERRADPQADAGGEPRPEKPLFGGRLLERVRGDGGIARGIVGRIAGPAAEGSASVEPPRGGGWPDPVRLREQLDRLQQEATAAGEPAAAVAAWAAETSRCLREVIASGGPASPHADRPLAALVAASRAGMTAADAAPSMELATLTRRTALGAGRRGATWQAVAGAGAELSPVPGSDPGSDLGPSLVATQRVAELVGLLHALERYEATQAAADAQAAQAVLRPLTTAPLRAAPAVVQAVTDHYLAPNLRVALHRDFIERILPEKTVASGRMEDFVLGRQVRGTNRIEQSLGVGFLPSRTDIRCELRVSGVVSSRTVTDGGIADIHSQGSANFVVRKPVVISGRGLAFGTALGSASNSARLAGVDTPFDNVPLMGSMMKSAVVNRFEDSREEAAREVNEKIIVRACRQVDREAEPKLQDMAERLRERVWMPMVELGLEPTPVQLETTESVATVRLRLAAAGQLAAHTPRSRVPEGAILSLQVHDSTLNNGCERLGIAGRRTTIEDLLRTVCLRLGLPPHLPPDLPEGVEVEFAAEEPMRVECRDGLVRLRLAIDTLQVGRRVWHDIVAQVTYRPVSAGMQVRLEREGKVKLSGAGQRGQLEIGLRTIFAKIFPEKRSLDLLPAALVGHPQFADVEAIQATATDGWFSLALAPRPAVPAVAPKPPEPPRRQAIGPPRPRRR
jgi:hypothetical protein